MLQNSLGVSSILLALVRFVSSILLQELVKSLVAPGTIVRYNVLTYQKNYTIQKLTLNILQYALICCNVMSYAVMYSTLSALMPSGSEAVLEASEGPSISPRPSARPVRVGPGPTHNITYYNIELIEQYTIYNTTEG